MSLTLIGLIILILVVFVALVQAKLEQSRLRQRLRRYEALDDKEGYQQQLESNIHLLENKQQSLNTQIHELQQKCREIVAKAYLLSVDSYEPKYDFISSGDYNLQLQDIISQQKRMQKNNKAYICETPWELAGESKREGKKMINDLLKMVEFAFEEQYKYTVKNVKHNNIDYLKGKINDSFNTINRLLKKIDCKISSDYLYLKLIQLDIQYKLEEKKQEERDREQEIKRQSKEREANQKPTIKVKAAQERETLHQKELEEVRQQIEQAEGEKRKQLELKIQQLEEELVEDRRDKENANRGKWGYIYIISNIGSFREKDVYRICMTNRQKEDEFIRELNPAVPFRFDVHFKIFSEDAVDTLERLHQRFNNKRVNLKNSRREFFQVSIDEIEQAVQEIKKKTGFLRIETFEPAPQAYEYHQTLAARKKHQQATTNGTDLEVD